MMMFSRTVSSLSSVSTCGTTPRRERIAGPSVAGSRSSTRNVPSVTGDTQPIMRIVELFPAPFGPRKPNASPLRTSKSMPSTAVRPPNRFVKPRAWMSASPADTLPTVSRSRPCPTRSSVSDTCLAEKNLRLGALQRVRDLLQLVLVGEDDLDASARHPRVEPGDALERSAYAGSECRVDRRRPHARLLLRARPLRTLLGNAHRQPLLHDLACEPAPAFVVGDGEHSACVTFRQLTALH